MNTKDIMTLFERIKKHYNIFGYDEEKIREWHRFLKEYSPIDVLNALDRFVLEYHDRPPFLNELTRGLTKVVEPDVNYVEIECDLCKKHFYVGNDWEEYNTHRRKCEKIDFIDRQAKEIHGKGITKEVYYNMSNEELDKNYRMYMKNWIKDNKEIAITPNNVENVKNFIRNIGGTYINGESGEVE